MRSFFNGDVVPGARNDVFYAVDGAGGEKLPGRLLKVAY